MTLVTGTSARRRGQLEGRCRHPGSALTPARATICSRWWAISLNAWKPICRETHIRHPLATDHGEARGDPRVLSVIDVGHERVDDDDELRADARRGDNVELLVETRPSTLLAVADSHRLIDHGAALEAPC